MNKSFASAFSLYNYCRWLRRRYGQILFWSLIAAIAGGYYSVKLFKNLRTDIEELLPATAPSVLDLKAAAHRMGALNHLSIVVESADTRASLRFVKDLSARMRALPKTFVDRVEDNIRNEQAFFEKHRRLYMDLQDWEDLEAYVKARFRYERRIKYAHSLLGPAETAVKPMFDIEALKKKYADRSAGSGRFPDGYFVSRDGRTRVVLTRMPGKVTDVKSNQSLSRIAHETVAALNPKSYAPDMVVGFGGDVQNVVEEHHGLIEDLLLSSMIVTGLVTLSLLVFFRSILGTAALILSLFAGTAWTFGLSYWLVGYLNANTAFMGSIVLGNGINFGIIMLARYMEERRKERNRSRALARSIGYTSQATWMAAGAAGLSYLSLILTDFRGFNQFGIIGGVGMTLCWISSFTTLPALLVFLERKKLLKDRSAGSKPFGARLVAGAVDRFYKPVFFLAIASVFVSIFYTSRLSKSTIENDLTKLRNKESLLRGAGYWGGKVDAVFESYLTPTLVMTADPRDTPKVAEALREVQRREGDKTPIAEIKTVEDLLPKDQTRKIRVMERIKGFLPPRVVKNLSPEDRKLVQELIPETLPEPLKPEGLPELLLMPFRELDGTIGRITHVYPKFSKGEFWNGDEVIRFTQRIRQGVAESATSALVAGQGPVSSDMIAAIKNDGPKATLFAFLCVVALVFLIFPQWKQSRAVLLALLLGVMWLLGLMGAFNLKINFLNFIALPITFGIGVDYGVNIFSRYRSDRARSIMAAIEHSGGAVSLCSLTTIIGFGSLMLASNQAFVSFGILATLGEVTCLTAAVVALPAALKYFQSRVSRPGSPRTVRHGDLRSLRF
ncbi:MAG: MMPL family transporter [Deltaproteobacteria bacterium]|nr:MMPL family transporter [Deltaproteobacteria bacterium]